MHMRPAAGARRSYPHRQMHHAAQLQEPPHMYMRPVDVARRPRPHRQMHHARKNRVVSSWCGFWFGLFSHCGTRGQRADARPPRPGVPWRRPGPLGSPKMFPGGYTPHMRPRRSRPRARFQPADPVRECTAHKPRCTSGPRQARVFHVELTNVQFGGRGHVGSSSSIIKGA